MLDSFVSQLPIIDVALRQDIELALRQDVGVFAAA
jgi:hypothetical protein